MKYVDKTFTAEMGGGCMVDFLILSNGRCVGINDECIVLYESYEQVQDGTGFLKMVDLWEGTQQ